MFICLFLYCSRVARSLSLCFIFILVFLLSSSKCFSQGGCTIDVTITIDNTNICPGQTAVLTADGASKYDWSPDFGLDATNIATITASPSVTTTYTVIGSKGNGCADTATVVVNVYQVPVL